MIHQFLKIKKEALAFLKDSEQLIEKSEDRFMVKNEILKSEYKLEQNLTKKLKQFFPEVELVYRKTMISKSSESKSVQFILRADEKLSEQLIARVDTNTPRILTTSQTLSHQIPIETTIDMCKALEEEIKKLNEFRLLFIYE